MVKIHSGIVSPWPGCGIIKDVTRKQGKRSKRRRTSRPTGKQHLLLVDHPAGMEDLARTELQRLGRHRLKVVDQKSQAETAFLYQGTPSDLGRLRLSGALYQVHHFDVPRPKALLGHEHWQRLIGEIRAVTGRFPPGTFQTFRIAAAGRFSSVFKRIKETVEADTGLTYDEDEADLQLRVRPANLFETGWEVLIRLTPRPLTSRAWRVFNYEGAVNGVVAAGMIAMSQPRRNESVLNLMSGSGTLLIERALIGAAEMLVGVDLDTAALAGAYNNIQAAQLKQPVELLQADATTMPLRGQTFDTILVDPPWGQLVGEQVDPQHLYPALLKECRRLAAPRGQLLIITHQLKLWEETMAPETHHWQPVANRQLFQGGLHPRIYHYRKVSRT